MIRIALVVLVCSALLGLSTPVSLGATTHVDGTASHITLLFHGSVQGEIIDCGCKNKPLGGLARRAALVESARADCGSQDCCLLVDAGSLLGRTDAKGQAQSKFLVRETASLGYQALGVGAWDLRHGIDAVLAAQSEGIPYTNANLLQDQSGELVFTPYRVSEVNGVRVGLISVISSEALAGIDLEGLRLRAPREALQRTLPELREQCDMVVLLAQMKSAELRQLLLDLNESPQTSVEIAVEGMGTSRYARPSQVGETWLLAANNRGKVLGRAEMIVAEDGEILDLDLEILELRLDLPEDPELAERVQSFQNAQIEIAGTQ